MQVYMADGARVGGEQVEEELPMVRSAQPSVSLLQCSNKSSSLNILTGDTGGSAKLMIIRAIVRI